MRIDKLAVSKSAFAIAAMLFGASLGSIAADSVQAFSQAAVPPIGPVQGFSQAAVIPVVAKPAFTLRPPVDGKVAYLPSPTPTNSPVPAATRAPTVSPANRAPTRKPTPGPTLAPGAGLNGISLDRIIVMPPGALANMRVIYAQGRALGRNPRAFSKVGDSTMVWPPFLALFDDPTSYNLGGYRYLGTTVDHFAGSFGRVSAAAKKGMHTWTEFDPSWNINPNCGSDEGPLPCELRLNNPSIAIIRLGANDYAFPNDFQTQLRRIIQLCISNGTIPVLGTKPDRMEGQSNTFNKIIMQLSREYKIPLWDYDLLTTTVPGKGLISDHVHIRGIGSHDYTSAEAFQQGDSLEDLSGLMMLDTIYRQISRPEVSK